VDKTIKKMKKAIIILIITCLIRISMAQDATVIYKNSVSSTVTIETDIGLGSGFFIRDNVIVTNFHVIEGASEAYCYTNNSSTKYKIEGYLAVDKSVDLILLKVLGLNRTALKIATSSVSPGQKVYVIGSPKGLPASISDGIISGLRDFEGYKLIQITAPISPGSSGGPVLNSNGEVIGVSVGQYKDGQNLNFAIPKSNLELLLKTMTSSSLSLAKLYNKFGSFIDNRDGEIYKTVKIGTQIWMTENLRTTKFNDGTPIPLVSDPIAWSNLTTPAYCWYNNDESKYKAIYGPLYNWYIVNMGNLCPIGWHLPSDTEWTLLTTFLGGEYVAGGKLKSMTGWNSPNFDGTNTGATNETGFTALPGGYRFFEDGSFNFFYSGFQGNWWSSTEHPSINSLAWCRIMIFDDYNVKRFFNYKSSGLSVRCIKD
jgi:uncharacterized protein (TIGR02145 family)